MPAPKGDDVPDTATAAPYREDPREAEIAKLKKSLASSESLVVDLNQRLSDRYRDHEREEARLKEQCERDVDRARHNPIVRAFGKVMLAAMTLVWLAGNVTAGVLPAYLFLRWHMRSEVMIVTLVSAVSWLAFYAHVTSLSESR